MNEETLLHLANLARLSVPPEERAALAKDIENIVGFVNTVQNVKVDVSSIPENDRVNVFRSDEVKAIKSEHDLVEAAPLHRDHFVEVPKVIE